MPVHLDVAFGFLKGLFQVFAFGQYLLDDVHVVGDRLLANQDAGVFLLLFYLFEPGVRSDISKCVALRRIRIQNLFNQVAAISTDEVWNCIISV